MPEIDHREGIAAPRHRVYGIFATTKGLTESWTNVEGNSQMDAPITVSIQKRRSTRTTPEGNPSND